MTKEDYYDILEIGKGANQKTIKKAYNKMIFTYHPDNAEEEEKEEYRSKFREIQEAYDILSDSDKKEKYD
jgi:molecular chaperone DnaJ